LTTVTSYFQQEVRMAAELQDKPFNTAELQLVIESGKQGQPRRDSECSTNASASVSSGSDTEDGITNKSGLKYRGPEIDAPIEIDDQFVGVNVSGRFQCPDCNQKFDTENAMSLHCKFIHSRHISQSGYTLVYEFDQNRAVDA
jgi:hypothetical protein